MRKPISIFFTFLILGISMQLGIATHFCGSELAQVKMVYGYGKAGCGMDCNIPSNEPNHQDAGFQKLSCCKDYVFTVAADEYQPVSQKLLIVVHQNISPKINLIFTPVLFILNRTYNSIPPSHTAEVFLPFIQVFLI